MEKLGRDIRRAHIVLNLCMETADMTAAMYRCGITDMGKEHRGGGVDNRTMPYVGVPVVARAMPTATVGVKILVDLTKGPESPASPAQALTNPAEESGSPERPDQLDADHRERAERYFARTSKRARAMNAVGDNHPQPDVALIIAVLRILPPTITEDIREARLMLATLEGSTDGRDPPLDALAACREDMHLWAGEAARAVTSIAACFRGKAARNSMAAVSDKAGDKATGGGVEGTQLVATPRTTAFQLADTFAPPKTPRLAQYIQPMPAGALRLVTEVTNRAAAQGPVTRSSSRLAAIAIGQASEGIFGWPRGSPQGMVPPNVPMQPCVSDEDHSNDTSMEEYVYTMLSDPLGPVAPSARGRVSGVPALVRAGPRTRSASLDQVGIILFGVWTLINII